MNFLCLLRKIKGKNLLPLPCHTVGHSDDKKEKHKKDKGRVKLEFLLETVDLELMKI